MPTATATKGTRKANSGSFKPGYDRRRHYFSRDEQRKGFASFLRRCLEGTLPSRVQASVRRRITRYYQTPAAERRVPVNLDTWPVEEPCPF
jgi:hypothetical protein